MATVKVRIAVAVDPDGRWSAAGWSRDTSVTDAEFVSCAIDGLDSTREAIYFVTAELPVPTTKKVAGNVEPA